MKKSIAALALALTLAGTLASCGSRDLDTDHNTGNAGSQNGVTSGNAAVPGSTGGGTSGAAGTVSRRYGGENAYNSGRYFDEGRYTAGPNGHVYSHGAESRDLTQDARDIVRDAGDAIRDVGRGIGDAARDVTGTNNTSGASGRESDSSAVRF